ncbi:MAG: type II secretion system minor pseudopilin GspK [Nitrospirae bacterium]|nr:type II secretion system minor pseudopilin GspK [Nitrospirota bacterium]
MYAKAVLKSVRQSDGTVVILTLLIITLLMAMIVEFAYSVYVGTNTLYNYRDGQRLSVLASSGVEIAVKYLRTYISTVRYTTFSTTTIPVGAVEPPDNTAHKSSDNLVISVRDENAKFNVNSIISENGKTNEKALNSFKRLLKHLSIDEGIAYHVADWIDQDKEERVTNSEKDAKNTFIFSTDELLLIKKLSMDDYKKLLPYITVYSDGLININTVEKPVLFCLSEDISENLADRIIEYRKTSPFTITSDIQKVPGLEHSGKTLLGRISVKSDTFSITSEATNNDITRDVLMVASIGSGSETILYWKEF